MESLHNHMPKLFDKLKPYATKTHIGLLLIGAGSVLVITVLVIALNSTGSSKTTPSSPATNQPKLEAVVEITKTGFLPSSLIVHPNTMIVWVNTDTAPHLVAADPYPTHASLKSLVAPSALGEKETYSYLVTKKAIIHYHDDLHPQLTGNITVK